MDNFFDKYELYTQGNSVYCYSGTSVLKNKLNIREQQLLWQAEADIVFAALLELEMNPIVGKLDKRHLYDIHLFLFRDFYEFAGQTRKEDISKGSTKFCVYQYIDEQLNELFDKVNLMHCGKSKEEVVDFLAYVMAELNIIHPFIEGNGRVIREFIREYADWLGFKIFWERLSKFKLIDSMIKSVFSGSDLKACLFKAIEKNNNIFTNL